MSSKQDAAVAFANAVIQVAQQMRGLRQQVNELLIQNTDQSYLAILTLLPSAPQNTDGSLGTTGAANVAQPLVNPALTKAVTETMLANMVQTMGDWQVFLTGSTTLAAKNRGLDIDNLAS